MPTTDAASVYLSVGQVAARLNRSPETVRRWIRGGALTAIQPGNRGPYLVSDTDLAAFLQKGGQA